MKRILDKIEIYIMLITFPLMVLFIFLATVFRYLQLGSLTWAEETSRFLMIWLVFAGIGIGFKHNAHLGLSFVVDLFPERLQKLAGYFRVALIFLFGLLILIYSYQLIMSQIDNGQLSPVLGIPVWWVYSSLLFGSILIVIRSVQMVAAPSGEHGKENVNSQL